MKIALVGYGKMGHMVGSCAKKLGHEIVTTVDVFSEDASVRIPSGDSNALAAAIKSCGAEGVIEFSHPSSVMENIKALLPLGLPLVVGTTGWNERIDEVRKLALECGGTLVASANFSIGVNMLYRIVSEAVKIMEPWDEYDVAAWEVHHNQKADSPSGTALAIAKAILSNTKKKDSIVTDAFHEKPLKNQLHVSSTRLGSVPGTHSVFFDSPSDTIEITHRARNREGFAMGAVHALERLSDGLKTGKFKNGFVYGIEDLF